MKKILAPILFAFVVFFSAKAFSQTNLTWVLSDKHTEGYFKGKTDLNGVFLGITNEKEATSFCNKLRENKNVASVQSLGKDASGNYKINIKMKESHNGKYYAEWLQKLNVSYIQVDDQKKSVQDILNNTKK